MYRELISCFTDGSQCLWLPETVRGDQWFFGYRGYQWLSVISCGYQRLCMVTSGFYGYHGYQWLPTHRWWYHCPHPFSSEHCTHHVRLFGLFILHTTLGHTSLEAFVSARTSLNKALELPCIQPLITTITMHI